jgi:Na+/melibiose symporter-like transporter
VGGALLEKFWWGSVFLINVPIIVAGLIAIAILVPESKDPKPGRIDVLGVLGSIVGLVALVYGIIDGGDHGFDRPQAWGGILLGLAVLALFVWHERRSDHPSLDVKLFKERRFSSAVATVGLVFFAALGTMFFLAFYLQLLRGYSPLQAGLLMTPFAAAQLIFAPRSAAMVKRYGPKAVCAAGLALVTVGLAGFAFVGATTPIWVLIVLTFVQGAGMANVIPPATESVMSSLPREKAGVGSAISNTVRQVGGSLGVAILGAVLSAVYRNRVTPSLDGLPAQVRDAAAESIAGAHGAAEHIGPAGAPLVAAADQAFVSAMHWAAAGSAVVALFGLVIALAFMPRRSSVLPAGAPVAVDTTSEIEAPVPATAGSPAPAGAGMPKVVIGTPQLVIDKIGDRSRSGSA